MDTGYFVYTDDTSNLSELILKVEHVYNRIADEISAKMYINRLLYSMTLDLQYIRNIVTFTQTGREFEHKLTELSSEPILVYGAGKRGRQLVELFPNMNWKGYIDKKQRGRIGNLEVKSCEDYASLGDSIIVISNQSGYKEIELELRNKGINKDHIIVLEEWNKKASQNQYFEARCIQADKIANGFVDAGSYDGMDSIRFLKWMNHGKHKIWAFEPDNIQYEICKLNLDFMKSAKIYNVALSDAIIRGGVIVPRYSGGTYISDKVMPEGMETMTVSLDEMLAHEKIGYIKMDIEGYEKKLCGDAKI